MHSGGSDLWLQNFFYQGAGVVVWAFLTPLLIRFTKRYDLTSDQVGKALLAHILLSIPLALLHRSLAMLIDFGIRDLLGMGFLDFSNPFTLIYRFRFMILSSAINNFFSYWLLIMLLSGIRYYMKRKERHSQKSESGKDHLANQLKVKVDGVYRFIPIDQIVNCEASGNYITLFTNQEQFKIRETMNRLESRLGPSFIRVHRSFIVNLNYLESFEHMYQGEYLLKLQNGRQLTSTRGYRENLQVILAKN